MKEKQVGVSRELKLAKLKYLAVRPSHIDMTDNVSSSKMNDTFWEFKTDSKTNCLRRRPKRRF